ncbi:GH25 family lysozyme [Arthrobacter rhizosphaerae]|uniref:GH25 family lysozyme n=1 Tax=Arthrobacter rhizosphaerae TaxID=2855490 RepID=UPI001FF500B0|nr:GH25 family lysozyme [Arthrobacter rhizosphaerae]
MKWIPVRAQDNRRAATTAFLLSIALLAGAFTMQPAAAVEPEPSAATATPTPTPSPTSTATLSDPSASGPPDASQTTLAEVVANGGAEMGQRSARVTGAVVDPTGPKSTLSTESLVTQGTWSPTFGVQGLDVSAHQPSVDWQHQWNLGSRFAYVKATEGNYYASETYGSQYAGSRNVGMIRGAYHFAIPNWSSGADQARYFVRNGGGWTPDGYTLPPVLDFEFNPYQGRTISGFYFGNTCYDMSPAQLIAWVQEFGNTVRSMTGRLPVIYTNTNWWNQCTGGAQGFGDYPLWVAAYPNSPTNDAGPIPSSWSSYSIWQYSSTGPMAGDSNVWNGSYQDLQTFAQNFQEQFRATAEYWGLGTPVSKIVCGLVRDGCLQDYAYATIYRSQAGGIKVVADPIRKAWWNIQGQGGPLGYPVSPQTCGLVRAGCTQDFEFGSMYITPTGAVRPVATPVRNKYWSLGGQNSVGYPLANEICGLTGNGCAQQFEAGNIYRSAATSPRAVLGPPKGVWAALGNENGVLGYPSSDYTCNQIRQGCVQDFQGGSIYTSVDGTFPVKGQTRSTYWALGGPASRLGFPAGSEICGLPGDGCQQKFQFGSILKTSGGRMLAVSGEISRAYDSLGGPKGVLGYPSSEQIGLSAGGLQQDFDGGSLYYSAASGTHSVLLSVRTTFWQSGGHAGPLGFPTSDLRGGLIRGGMQQDFQGGSLYATPSNGLRRILGQARTFYWSNGGQGGELGYPTGDEACGLPGLTCQQNFETGQIVTAKDGRFVVAGRFGSMWQKLGGLYSYLGSPVDSRVCGLVGSGCKQSFQTGAIFDSPAAGTHATGGAIGTLWGAHGAESGRLGYPTTDLLCSGEVCTQSFQGGSIRWTPSTGAYFG